MQALRLVTPGASLALLAPLGAGCVLPPPLDVVTTDAGLNAPPIIKDGHDGVFTPLRPPAIITVNRAMPSELTLTLYDVDAGDELYVQLFNDYDPQSPADADVNCGAPPTDGTAERVTICSTVGLCSPSDVGGGVHRLEIEVYDRPPEPNTPFRSVPAGGLFSTLTVDLICIDEST